MQVVKIYEVINVEDSIRLEQVDAIKIEYSLDSEYGLKSLVLETFSSLKSCCEAVILFTLNFEKDPIVIKGFKNLEFSVIDEFIWLHTFRAALLCNSASYYVIHYSKTNNVMVYLSSYKKVERAFKLLDLFLADYWIVSGNSIISMRNRYDKKN